jgi:transposase
MRKKRKNYTAEEKVRLLKQHLVNGVAVSEICDQNELQPTVFYRWQRQLFEKGAAAFQTDQDREVRQMKQEVSRLEEKIAKKNEVLGELMEEHIGLKKSLGEV